MLVTHNGVNLPSFMYGTAWKKDATAKLVKQALQKGFTAIDTANQLKHYDEKLVGDALQEAYADGASRDKLFLQTKFTSRDGQDHRLPYDAKADLGTQVMQSMQSSLDHLRTDYVDSYVLHGPHFRNGFHDEDWQVWRAIEELYASKKAKIIGVSNVNAGQLSELCADAKVKPMVVQNRCYAVAGWDRDVRNICEKEGIIYQGFSLLTANPQVMMSDVVQASARRLNATPAQIIFAFSMQIGMLPLTGTTSAEHMEQDLKSSALQLTQLEIEQIESAGIASSRLF